MQAQKIILSIMFLTLTLGISSAEIYKWVDEKGVTHYSDSPTRDIPDTAESENDDIQSSAAAPADRPPVDDTRKGSLEPDFFDFLKESQDDAVAVNTPTVEIYETSWCGYCKKAKNYFRSRGIDFVVYNIEKDRQAAHRMRTMTNKRVVPFVVINGQGITGYSEQAYARALQN